MPEQIRWDWWFFSSIDGTMQNNSNESENDCNSDQEACEGGVEVATPLAILK